MKTLFLIALLPVSILANVGSFSTFSGFGQTYGYNNQGLEAVHHVPVVAAPYAPKPVAYAQPAYQPAYQPTYGYEQPKHNCSVSEVTEVAQVCTPAFEKKCENVELAIKKIVDKEFCYDVVRTVCTEKIEQVANEVCSFSYKQKEEDTTAKTVEVTFVKEVKVQMVTVCAPHYGGYGSYGSYGSYGASQQYCKEVAQETAFNVPVVTPVDVPVKVAYPEAIKSCVNKPIDLPRVTCENLTEKKCITVPEVENATESIEKCDTKLGAPSCQQVELTLPKQMCIELVYGYAEDTYHQPAAAPAEA